MTDSRILLDSRSLVDMSINAAHTLSDLKSALTGNLPKTDKSPGEISGKFASRLEKALENVSSQDNAALSSLQTAAELLKLETLRRSMNLLDDRDDSSQGLNSIVPMLRPPLPELKSYLSNLQKTVERQPEQSSTSKTLAARETSSDYSESNPIQKTSVRGSAIEPIIQKASRQYGVDADLIRAVIRAESNFNPTAVSHAGAQGLMQLMPSTARGLGVQDPFNPEQNIMGGTKFLKNLLDRYNGDMNSALAAYNWGPGNVDRKPDRLPRETRDYLVKVRQYLNQYQG